MTIGAMTIGKGAASTASASQTLGQFISALAQEVPDTKLLMRIVDRVPVGVAIVRGPEMRFTLVNAAYAAILATPGRMLGRRVADVFPTMPKPAWRCWRRSTRPARRSACGGIRQRPTWGAARLSGTWTSSHCLKPRLTAGQPAEKGVLIIARDVTRQILSERAGESLRATEARLNIALEAADLGAWSARNEATEFMSSPHAAVLHGLSPDTVVDHETAMSVDPPGRPRGGAGGAGAGDR